MKIYFIHKIKRETHAACKTNYYSYYYLNQRIIYLNLILYNSEKKKERK